MAVGSQLKALGSAEAIVSCGGIDENTTFVCEYGVVRDWALFESKSMRMLTEG